MVDFFNQKNKIKEFDDTLKMVADAFDENARSLERYFNQFAIAAANEKRS